MMQQISQVSQIFPNLGQRRIATGALFNLLSLVLFTPRLIEPRHNFYPLGYFSITEVAQIFGERGFNVNGVVIPGLILFSVRLDGLRPCVLSG